MHCNSFIAVKSGASIIGKCPNPINFKKFLFLKTFFAQVISDLDKSLSFVE